MGYAMCLLNYYVYKDYCIQLPENVNTQYEHCIGESFIV